VAQTIILRHIDYSVEHKHLLKDVSFSCNDSERLCIFGENGAGKSTLMKVMCGNITPDSGKIEKIGHTRFVYVSQEFDHGHDLQTVESYIKEQVGETLFKKIFNLGRTFGYDLEHNKTKYCKELSGGQQKILALSVAFASNPNFLLLDEPENHLDIVSRQVLIELMQNFRGGIIFISHDRLVIDSVVTKIGELADGIFQISEGGYDDYIEMKMSRIAGEQRTYDAESKRIKKLSSALIIMKQKAIRGKEVSAYHKTKDEITKLKSEHRASDRPEEKRTRIKIATNSEKVHSGKLLFRVEKGSFHYPENKKFLFTHVDLELRTGAKIVLLGRNGIGKSTFLKCITKQLIFNTGEVSWAKDISVSLFNQHIAFDENLTPIQIVSYELSLGSEETKAILGSMKFDLQRMETPVKLLSGGERMRVRFALTFGPKPDFIILDEPTNHIDEVTWEILLEACKSTTSALLLITHDYEFIESLEASKYWVIHKETITEKHKDIDELLELIQS
jgi:ATPase subunit of ABC transporter with duplicated ATPase domains